MSNGTNNNSDLAYADTLWKATDALRGQIDAAEYKHVVLGFLFLMVILKNLAGLGFSPKGTL